MSRKSRAQFRQDTSATALGNASVERYPPPRARRHVGVVQLFRYQFRFLALFLLLGGTLGAQESSLQMSGPLIQSGGPSFQVPDATFPIPKGHVFRVMWALNQHADSSRPNAQMGTIARFFNLHARHGIAAENLRAAAVINGNAWMALLTDEAYQRRYGRPNPSKALVQELMAHGTRFAVCGQTALSMGVRGEELLPGVQMAISAMTALNVFYADGYRLQTWQ